MSLRSSKAQTAYATRDSELSRAVHQSTELADIASGKNEFLHGVPPSLDFSESPLTAGIIGSVVGLVLASCTAHLPRETTASVWLISCLVCPCVLFISLWITRKLLKDFTEFERLRERWEVDNFPDGEIMEMVEIYTGYGVSEADAQSVARTLSKYKDFWVDHMLLHEIGIIPSRSAGSETQTLGDQAYPYLTFFCSLVIPLYSVANHSAAWIPWAVSLLQLIFLLVLKVKSCQWLSYATSLTIALTVALTSGVLSQIARFIQSPL